MRVDIVFVTQTISFKHVFHSYLKKNVHWLRLGVDVDPVEPTAARMGLMDVPVKGKGKVGEYPSHGTNLNDKNLMELFD